MYRLHVRQGVINLSTDTHILPIKSDARWRDYQAWVKAGNVPEPAIIPEPEPDPGPGVPVEVTMRQARLALLNAGLLDTAQGVIDALPMPARRQAQIEWEYALSVRRDHPLIALMIGEGLATAEEVDGLFVAAAGL